MITRYTPYVTWYKHAARPPPSCLNQLPLTKVQSVTVQVKKEAHLNSRNSSCSLCTAVMTWSPEYLSTLSCSKPSLLPYACNEDNEDNEFHINNEFHIYNEDIYTMRTMSSIRQGVVGAFQTPAMRTMRTMSFIHTMRTYIQ